MTKSEIAQNINKYPYVKKIVSIFSHPLLKIKNLQKIKAYSKENVILPEFNNMDYESWNKSFRNLMLLSNEIRFMDMIDEFYHESLILLKNHTFSTDNIIVVCLLKNEKYRVKKFVEHYRKIGADGFIFIDNGSEDGTKEFLEAQSDVALFEVKKTYNSIRKTAWINKVISYYGVNRWFIIPDSDEFFVYPEMDTMKLHSYSECLIRNKVYCVKTMMLELYPNAPFFDDKRLPDNFIDDYCYYDPDGLFQKRVFGIKDESVRPKPTMLFYDGKRFVIGSHDFYPKIEDINATFGGIVLHYKFLSNERKKIDKIVSKGIYANNSSLYKLYKKRFDEDNNYNAYYEGSLKWIGVESFNTFRNIKKLSEKEIKK